MATETSSPAARRDYLWHMPRNWWTRRSHYFTYILREFTALPLAVWLIWFLVEVRRAHHGAGEYYPSASIAFVIFSVICLGFALYHSITFLSLAGVILQFKVLDRTIPARVVVLAQFGIWAVASAVIAFVLIYFAR